MLVSAHEGAPLVGRLEERGLLTSLLDEVDTRGQALMLHGAPGIGKSRLLAEAERTARERGMAVLTTAGVQSEAHLPFAGLHQLLRPVRDRASRLRDVQRGALDAAFGLTHTPAPEPFRIAMAALDLLSDVAAESALLLIVEDAHWLDRPSADALAFVARRIESDPIVLLAAIRDGYPSVMREAGLPEHGPSRRSCRPSTGSCSWTARSSPAPSPPTCPPMTRPLWPTRRSHGASRRSPARSPSRPGAASPAGT